MVAELWAETGGSLRGTVIERTGDALRPRQAQALERAGDAGRRGPARDEQDQQQRGRAQRPAGAGAGRRSRCRPADRRSTPRCGRRSSGCATGCAARACATATSPSSSARASRGPSAASRGRWSSCCAPPGSGASSQTLLDSLPIAGVDGTLMQPHEERRRHRPGLPEDRHALGHARPRRLRARQERQGLRGGAGRHATPRRGARRRRSTPSSNGSPTPASAIPARCRGRR